MTFPFTLTERIPTCSFLCESFRGTEAHFVENCHLLQDEAFLALLLSLWKGTTPIVKIFSCWSDFSVLPMTVFVCQHERKTRVIKKKNQKNPILSVKISSSFSSWKRNTSVWKMLRSWWVYSALTVKSCSSLIRQTYICNEDGSFQFT